jgi:predicted O-linked N-acetylglucosamine transferase (SPINDLY family)
MEKHFQQAICLHQAGHIADAERLYREILLTNPNKTKANFNLGSILLEGGFADASLPFFKAALESDPNEARYWLTYINALIQARCFDDAQLVITYGKEAGLSGPEVDTFETWLKRYNNNEFQHNEETLPPSSEVDELINLFAEQRYEEVERKVLKLTQYYPNWLAGWKILSDTLLVQKKDARFAASSALALNLNDAKEHCYYGLVLKGQGDLKAAACAFEQAIKLNSDYAAAYNNLGIVRKDLGDVDGGIRSYRHALELSPDYASCYSNLLFCLSHSEKIDADILFKEHCQFSTQYELPIKASWPIHSNSRDVKRRLKIGFVSSDFRDHSLAYFIEPLLKQLSLSSNLILHAYSASAIKDSMTRRLRENFSIWNQVDGLPDAVFAQKIMDDRIDILVDLDGHTAGNRLLTFALKPAPIQVSWLGYFATTGLTAIDYYLADSNLLPPGKLDSQFTEKLVQLPANAPFTPYEASPEVNALPVLKKGYITFACFNRPNKITRSVVGLWCKLLTAIPNSKLLLGAMPQEGSYSAFVEWFTLEGINLDRLIFHPRSSINNYLKLHHEVDVCLDTFPSNGVTTTCHAVWMGVPTLCLEGASLTSRGALGIMKHVGLDDFIASDEDDFVRRGLLLASNIERLSEVRRSLRNNLNDSLLAQPHLIAESLEQSFHRMWKQWCSDLPAESFQINVPN